MTPVARDTTKSMIRAPSKEMGVLKSWSGCGTGCPQDSKSLGLKSGQMFTLAKVRATMAQRMSDQSQSKTVAAERREVETQNPRQNPSTLNGKSSELTYVH